jgi:hypothetical protein
MEYADETGSDAMIQIQSFITIRSGTPKLRGDSEILRYPGELTGCYVSSDENVIQFANMTTSL